MSRTGPNPSETPNPLYGPTSSPDRRGGRFAGRDAMWFIVGLALVGVLVGIFGYWIATSSDPVELELSQLEQDIQAGAVTRLSISGRDVEGDFAEGRQAYNGQVRGQNEPVPAGYTESDARAVTSFTATIPDGERENLIALAGEHSVSIEVE